MSYEKQINDEDEGHNTNYIPMKDIDEDGQLIGESYTDRVQDDYHDPDEPVPTGTVSSSVFNLSNTILGSGVLVMSHVCRTTGIFLFAILLLLVAIGAYYSIYFLCRGCELAKLKKNEYPALGFAAMGKFGQHMATYSIILQQLGACILYVQIVGSVIDPDKTLSTVSSSVVRSKAFWEILVVCTVIFPLCMLRTMDALRYTSFLAITFILLFVLFVMGNGIDIVSDRGVHGAKLFNWSPNIFSVIPALSFAFVCQQNVFPIYQEMKDRSVKKMKKVSAVSMCIAYSIYFGAGLFGYFAFINCANSNLMTCFLVSGSAVFEGFDVVRVGYGFAIIFSYPVMLFELRHCLDEVIFGHRPWTRQRQLLLNFCIISFCTLLAILIPNIGLVFEFIGATSGTMLVFVMPSMFYMKLNGGSFWERKHALPAFIMCCGFILMPTCIIASILGITGTLGEHKPEFCGCDTCDYAGAEGTCVETRGRNYTACI